MIPGGVEIFVALAPIDLRWGFDRLAGRRPGAGAPGPSRVSRSFDASARRDER
jgi:hypothetical protein